MYKPNQEILDKYASVLIDFALNSGKGIKPKEVVYIIFDTFAMDFGLALYKKVIKSGGQPLVKMTNDNFTRAFYELASDEQIQFFPEKFNRGLVDTIDHYLSVVGDEDPKYLKDIDPAKIMMGSKARKPLMNWMNEKEYSGNFTWTLGLYPSEAMAKEADLSLEEYWDQIIKACFLDEKDPVAKWKEVYSDMNATLDWINNLPIEKLHVQSKSIDLWIDLGEERKWLGGSGRNIPSFEIFTSPDWRGTNGKISFTMPLYVYGNLVDGVSLEFKDGVVVKSSAKKGEKVLKEMIAAKNANKVGEFSLTDKRFSRIDKFMANTLFDENFGGEFGNTHIALGLSYQDTYKGEYSKMKKEDWERLGFNDSSVHTDIVSTEDRTVDAVLKDGRTITIYKDGMFTYSK